MYDRKTEAREFVASSRSEAVAEAARFFGLDEGALRISDVAEQEVAGLGGRVVVVAAPQDAPRTVACAGDEGPRGRGERGGGRERGGRERGGRERGGRERGGRERGGRERDGRERGGRERGGRERGGRERGGRERGDDEQAASSAPRAEPVESVGTARGELGEVGTFMLGAVQRMGLGNFEVEEGIDGEYLIVRLEGEAAEELASGDGRGLDALQLLANQAAMRSNPDGPRVIVDVEGSSEKRETFLSRLANRAAKRAEDTGRTVALEPMNPRDRRIVHMALREEEGVATMSKGEGQFRQVVVVPEGAPEFEEAERSVQAAESGD